MAEDKKITTKNKKKYIYGKGSRKTSVARVRLFEKGKGNIEVNGKKLEDYFVLENFQNILKAPLFTVSKDQVIDLTIMVQGGGKSSQAQACCHGIARALTKLDAEFKPLLKAEGYLTRDSRMKERKKPGLKRARRAPQWSKR